MRALCSLALVSLGLVAACGPGNRSSRSVTVSRGVLPVDLPADTMGIDVREAKGGVLR